MVSGWQRRALRRGLGGLRRLEYKVKLTISVRSCLRGQRVWDRRVAAVDHPKLFATLQRRKESLSLPRQEGRPPRRRAASSWTTDGPPKCCSEVLGSHRRHEPSARRATRLVKRCCVEAVVAEKLV